jgi:hypothetical protein
MITCLDVDISHDETDLPISVELERNHQLSGLFT